MVIELAQSYIDSMIASRLCTHICLERSLIGTSQLAPQHFFVFMILVDGTTSLRSNLEVKLGAIVRLRPLCIVLNYV